MDIPQGQFIKGRWYLVSDTIVEGHENQVFPVRINADTSELEFPLDNEDVLFYSANREGDVCVITGINTDAASLIDYSELANVAAVMGADGTTQTNDAPSNVVGFFEV